LAGDEPSTPNPFPDDGATMIAKNPFFLENEPPAAAPVRAPVVRSGPMGRPAAPRLETPLRTTPSGAEAPRRREAPVHGNEVRSPGNVSPPADDRSAVPRSASVETTAAARDEDILDAQAATSGYAAPTASPLTDEVVLSAGPGTTVDGPQVEVANVSDGGFVYWLLRFYLFGAIAAAGLGACFAVGFYLYFAATLPPLPNLASYRAQVATTTAVRAWDGTPLAEFATERRDFIPFERIPKRLVQAFLAAEDRRFYEHGGLDYRGIARALGANLRAGEVAQGGSTITQQVAKSFLTSERTIQRKIREAILARRLEAHLTKNEILTLYLNQIFLGAGAFGVGGGARRYFDKSVDELDVGEMATLAGLVRAPSRFSPLTNLEAGRARRDQVLSTMVAAGYLTDAEATTWKARPLTIRPRPDFFRMYAPYFAENVRRDVARRYGDQKLWQECQSASTPASSKEACALAQKESDKKLAEAGFEIETTVVPWIDAAAQENVDFGLRKLDKRQGWRGPVARLVGPAAEEFRRRGLLRYGTEPPAEGRLYLGIVDSVSKDAAEVHVGKGVYALPSSGMSWAAPYDSKSAVNGRSLTSTAGVLHPGDVIWVRNAHRSKLRRFSDFTYDEKSEVQWMPAYDEAKQGKAPPATVTLALEQTPRVQGALFSYDHTSGYVTAMIGGDDYDRSEFNRVTQACRQPGSTYKPIYYSLAMDRGYNFSSLLNDVPRAEVDPITGEVWTPTNLNNTVEYQVSLEYALIWSKNVPSVQLFKLMGGHDVEAWARRLGITTPIIPDQALALGASCSRIDEMTRAFSAFANNGVLVDPISVRRVRDRTGKILEDNTWVGDPMGRPEDRLDQMVALAGREKKQAISPRTAWLTSTLLRHVVTRGHAPAIRNAAILAAGKTGTSSATMDVWFIGYTSRWMTTAWVGDDLRERPLGVKDAAFMITVPMFARYINEVGVGQPLREIPWERPATVKPGDTGGKVRTTVDEVLAEGKTPPPKPKAPAAKPAAPAPTPVKPAPPAAAVTKPTIKPMTPEPAASAKAKPKKHPHGH
jgi:penicillin-binding protein 1A